MDDESIALLERYMRIVKDIKKEFVYGKTNGKWYWHDRDDHRTCSPNFPTFWDCLADAVSPYVDENGDEILNLEL